MRWGHAFASADNGLRCFADGGSAPYDPLVGADGARSRVRVLLTDARPTHIGQNIVEVGIPDIDRTHPGLAAMVGRGNYWALGDGRVRIGLSFHNTAENWFATSGTPFDDPAAVKDHEREMFARTGAAARMSADIQELLMSPDAAQHMLAFFRPG